MNVSMDLVDSDTTTAFKSHFIFPRTSLGSAGNTANMSLTGSSHAGHDEGDGSFDDAEEGANDDDGESMVMAEDITSAFAASTFLFGNSAAAEAKRRRSLSLSPEKRDSGASTDQRVTAVPTSVPMSRDFQIPLGQEGVSEQDLLEGYSHQQQISLDKVRRGSKLFYASAATPSTGTYPFAPSPSESMNQMQGIFSQYHSATYESVSSTASSSGIYPSLNHLRSEVPVPEKDSLGASALAFLDRDDDDGQEHGSDATTSKTDTAQPRPLDTPAPTVAITPAEESAHGHDVSSQEVVEHDEEQVYLPLEQPLFVPRASRLSIVPENRLAEEEAEEEEDDIDEEQDDDQTQDMDETTAFGRIISTTSNDGVHTDVNVAPMRRLSIMHPSANAPPTAATAAASPMKIWSSTANISSQSMSPTKIPKRSSPVKSSLVRRQSLSAASGTASALGETARADLFRSVPASVSTAAAAGLSPLPSPRRATYQDSTVMQPPPVSPFRPALLTPSRARTSTFSTTPRLSPAPQSANEGTAIRQESEQQQRPEEASLPQAPTSEPFFQEDDHDDVAAVGQGLEQAEEKLSLDNFLQMIDIQFIDSLLLSASQSAHPVAASKRRRSTELGADGEDRSKSSSSISEVRLVDQIRTSGVTIPYMDMYKMMVQELRGSLKEDNALIQEIEMGIEDGDVNPDVFREYLQGGEEDRALMEVRPGPWQAGSGEPSDSTDVSLRCQKKTIFTGPIPTDKDFLSPRDQVRVVRLQVRGA